MTLVCSSRCVALYEAESLQRVHAVGLTPRPRSAPELIPSGLHSKTTGECHDQVPHLLDPSPEGGSQTGFYSRLDLKLWATASSGNCVINAAHVKSLLVKNIATSIATWKGYSNVHNVKGFPWTLAQWGERKLASTAASVSNCGRQRALGTV